MYFCLKTNFLYIKYKSIDSFKAFLRIDHNDIYNKNDKYLYFILI